MMHLGLMMHLGMTFVYRIAQNFGGKKHWQIWQMKLYPPMFFLPIILTIENMEIFFGECALTLLSCR